MKFEHKIVGIRTQETNSTTTTEPTITRRFSFNLLIETADTRDTRTLFKLLRQVDQK